MSGALYIFNPENDLSVANGGENYMPPPRARIIAEDLAFLPVWYAENGDDVIVPSERYIDWMHSERASLGCFSEVVLKGRLPDKNWTACIPGGGVLKLPDVFYVWGYRIVYYREMFF